MTRPILVRSGWMVGCVMAAQCTNPPQDRASPDSVRVEPVPAVARPEPDTLQRYVLVSLNGQRMPAHIYNGDGPDGSLCADTTHAAHYELTRDQWMHEETVSSSCPPPADRHVVEDSGQLERKGNNVVFHYEHGGAIQGTLVGDSLVVADGGPVERYVRVPKRQRRDPPSNER
jgi:hypothetical protein